MNLADGTAVPDECVDALARLDLRWPGATLPQARGAVVVAVLGARATEPPPTSNAGRIAQGLAILARYGEVDCAAEHDEFFAGVAGVLSREDLDEILALGWRSDSDGGPGSFAIFV